MKNYVQTRTSNMLEKNQKISDIKRRIIELQEKYEKLINNRNTDETLKWYLESSIARAETNDCVVRAFASSFDINYDFAHKFVAEYFNREPRKGTRMTASKMVKMFDDKIEINGKRVYIIGRRDNDWMGGSLTYDVKGKTTKREMTVGTFIKNNPVGTFFILVRGHAFTIKNGVVIGNQEDSIKKRRIIRCAFEIR
jgi:hypothetical protein